VTRKQVDSSRRRARELALQVLYAIDLATGRPRSRADEDAGADEPTAEPSTPRPLAEPDPDAVFDAVAHHFEMPPGARDFARELVAQVRSRTDSLDATIAAHARNWRVARMAAVDRNILRLATFELTCTQTPGAVVLNEAVDLARRFGDDPSPAFVNGILDAVARDVRESQA
jgi:transcription antitermination factor NusB